MEASTRVRKRRKWDVTASDAAQSTATTPTSVQQAAAAAAAALFPTPATPAAGPKITAAPVDSASVAQGAAAVVERINQDLVAKGLLPSRRLGPSQPEVKEIAREVTINNAPAAVRHQLTRRQCQEDISRRTKAVLTVKGRYYPPGVPEDGKEKPLFLRIIPSSNAGETDEDKQAAVDAAATEVECILQGRPSRDPSKQRSQGPPLDRPPAAQKYSAAPPTGPSPYSAVPPPSGDTPAAASATNTLKVYVGFTAPPSFRLEARLVGPSSSYLAHIQNETGSEVLLQGHGSGFTGDGSCNEALHFLLKAATAKALEDARQLSQNLIDTTRASAEKELPGQITYELPQRGLQHMGPYRQPHQHGPYSHPPPYPARAPGYTHHAPPPYHYPQYIPPQPPPAYPPPQSYYNPPPSVAAAQVNNNGTTAVNPPGRFPVAAGAGAPQTSAPSKRRFLEGPPRSEQMQQGHAGTPTSQQPTQSTAAPGCMGPPPPRQPQGAQASKGYRQQVEPPVVSDAGPGKPIGLVDYGDED